jgi:hypothetical protein
VDSVLPGGANYVLRALELFAEYGDREALRKGDQTLTFAELRASVHRRCAAEHGVPERGDTAVGAPG